MSKTNDALVCGKQIQHDNSGAGHNWRDVDAKNIDRDVIEALAGEIIDGAVPERKTIIVGGLHYRWVAVR